MANFEDLLSVLNDSDNALEALSTDDFERLVGEIHGKIIFQDQSAKATASTSMVLNPKTKKKPIEGC